MVEQSLAYLVELTQTAIQAQDWKVGLDAFFPLLRRDFVFDNLAIYTCNLPDQNPEVVYARAVGRGKSAEADAAWGEVIAGQVIAKKQIVLQESEDEIPIENRLSRPHLLGIPLHAPGLMGAVVFVRFGGPTYVEAQVYLASIAAALISNLLEKRIRQEQMKQLEDVRSQMQLQEDFVATISHELRTPLGFIKGYSTTLLRQDTTWDLDTQREFLNIIDEETDRLTELIENILESARLQSSNLILNFQPLRLDALIRDIVMRVQTRQKELQVRMDFKISSPIQGDSVRLSQVFENLINNAVKYAPNSPIDIVVEQRDDKAQITCTDYGPGISSKHLPFIFERFYRVPDQPGRTGTGLGLYICKQIVKAHHGKIWAESKPGKGTVFYIELPVG
jgi:signal transduction histidine kinase